VARVQTIWRWLGVCALQTAAAGLQRRGDLAQAGDPHVDHQRQSAARQQRPVGLRIGALTVAGDQHHAARMAPVGHRHADRRRPGQAGRQPADDLDLDAGGFAGHAGRRQVPCPGRKAARISDDTGSSQPSRPTV
jgi:hypothetical protein